jgi:hypothetical protein
LNDDFYFIEVWFKWWKCLYGVGLVGCVYGFDSF